MNVPPKIVHVWSGPTADPETARRIAVAQASINHEAAHYGNWQELDLSVNAFPRNAQGVGDPAPLPFIHDMIEAAALDLKDEDIIFITNADIGVYLGIGDELAELCSKHGAVYAYRWDFPRLEAPLVTKDEIARGKWYVGCDAFAFTKKWWLDNRQHYPDFVLGRECWDWILRALISEKGGAELQKAIFHEKHASPWKQNRAMQPGNVYNRSYARAWLQHRKLPLREIANAPFKPVPWPPPKWVERKRPTTDSGKMDVLISLGGGSKWGDSELRYCLRALEKHAINLGRVFVVGRDPGFLSKEVTVVVRQDANKNKEHNIAETICWSAANLDITEHFLFVNDDHFFLQDTDIMTYPYYNAGDLGPKWERSQKNGYRCALMQTDAQLKAKKLPVRNYEIHVPIIYSRSGLAKLGKWLDVCGKVPYGMTWRSVYCNVLGIKPGPHYRDVKIGNCATVGEFKAKIAGLHLFSIGDGLSDEVKAYFEVLYPNKSKYEA